MTISARNGLKRKVATGRKGAFPAHAAIQTVTASITHEPVDGLALAARMTGSAVIEAGDVMLGID